MSFSPESARQASLVARAKRRGHEEGALLALEEFIPAVVETVRARQALMPRLLKVVDDSISSGDTSALKDLAPLVKTLLDEDKRLLDRVLGSAVQRQKIESESRVVHMSLSDLVFGPKEDR